MQVWGECACCFVDIMPAQAWLAMSPAMSSSVVGLQPGQAVVSCGMLAQVSSSACLQCCTQNTLKVLCVSFVCHP
jgi:hypothetical protein